MEEDALFSLLQPEHSGGLTSALQALLPVPDPQASPDLHAAHMNLSNTEITQDQNRLHFLTKQIQEPACEPVKSWLPAPLSPGLTTEP